MRYRIGIDPGERFIGIDVGGTDDNDIAVPVDLAVVDLKGDPHQTDIRKLVKGRAEHRLAWRTRKALSRQSAHSCSPTYPGATVRRSGSKYRS